MIMFKPLRMRMFLIAWAIAAGKSDNEIDHRSQSKRIPEVGRAVMEWFQASSSNVQNIPRRTAAKVKESDYGGYDTRAWQTDDEIIDVVNEKVLFLHSGLEYRDGGLFAKEYIEEGTLLFHVPHEYLWTPESHFPFQDAAPSIHQKQEDTTSLSKDRLRFQHRNLRECQLAQRLAKEWANTHTLRPYHPYLEYLAIHANETIPNLPAVWSTSGRDALKQVVGSLVDQEPLIQRNQLDASYTEACSQHEQIDDLSGIDSALVEKAHRIVVSRSWYGTAVPLYDFLNHNCAFANADDDREVDKREEETYTIVAIHDIDAGEELLDCYHDHTWFNSLTIFWQFGFVEPSDQLNFVFQIPLQQKDSDVSSLVTVEWITSYADSDFDDDENFDEDEATMNDEDDADHELTISIKIHYPNHHGYTRHFLLPGPTWTKKRIQHSLSPIQKAITEKVFLWVSSHVERLLKLQNFDERGTTKLHELASSLPPREAALLKQLHSTLLESFQKVLLITKAEIDDELHATDQQGGRAERQNTEL